MTTTTATPAAALTAATDTNTTTTPPRPSRSSTFSSTTSSSDFQVLSSNGGYSDSEDEIVWSLASSVAQVSDLGDGAGTPGGARVGGSVASNNNNSDPEVYHSLASDDDDDDDFVVLTRRTRVRGVGHGALGGIDTPVRSSSTRPTDDATAGPTTVNAAAPAATPTTATFLQARLEALALTAKEVDFPVGASGPIDSTKLSTEIIEKREKNEEAVAREDKKQAHDAAQSLPTPDITPKRERKAPVSLTASSAPIPSGSTGLDLANSLSTNEVQAPAPASTISPKKKKKGKKSKAARKRLRALAKENSTGTGTTTQPGEAPKKAKKSKKKASKKAASGVASGAKVGDTAPVDPSLFKEASDYISSFLTSPEARSNAICRLTLLQSLIVELGLVSSVLDLPASLKSAKTFLKTRAFLNIKEYISVRGQGQEAIRKLLYPSRSALIKDIRKKRNVASLQWVKEHGLQVLLVGCFH